MSYVLEFVKDDSINNPLYMHDCNFCKYICSGDTQGKKVDLYFHDNRKYKDSMFHETYFVFRYGNEGYEYGNYSNPSPYYIYLLHKFVKPLYKFNDKESMYLFSDRIFDPSDYNNEEGEIFDIYLKGNKILFIDGDDDIYLEVHVLELLCHKFIISKRRNNSFIIQQSLKELFKILNLCPLIIDTKKLPSINDIVYNKDDESLIMGKVFLCNILDSDFEFYTILCDLGDIIMSNSINKLFKYNIYESTLIEISDNDILYNKIIEHCKDVNIDNVITLYDLHIKSVTNYLKDIVNE